jgi:hypothetical protein
MHGKGRHGGRPGGLLPEVLPAAAAGHHYFFTFMYFLLHLHVFPSPSCISFKILLLSITLSV